MKVKQIIRTLIILVVLSSNIGCDQVSKSIVRQKIGAYEQIPVIQNCFTLTKVENTGAFLSIGYNLPQPVKIFLLTILPLVILAMALVFLLINKRLSAITVLAICFVVGGGIGNIYDRIIYGSVTDFMHINFGLFETGIFNMADVSIMTGIFLLIVETTLKRTKQPTPTS